MQVTFDLDSKVERDMVRTLLAVGVPTITRAPVHEEEPDERIPTNTPPALTDADEPQMEKDLAEKKAAVEAAKAHNEKLEETPVVDELVFDDIVNLLRSYLVSVDADKRPAAQDKLRIALKEACGVTGTADLKEDQYRAAYDALQKHIGGMING